MTSGLFLAISLPLALIPAAIAVALSGEPAANYTKLLQPGVLLVDCGLSLWVALMYCTDLRRAFLFLSAFLLLYGLVNVNPLVEEAMYLTVALGLYAHRKHQQWSLRKLEGNLQA